jgi:hypothetical protein
VLLSDSKCPREIKASDNEVAAYTTTGVCSAAAYLPGLHVQVANNAVGLAWGVMIARQWAAGCYDLEAMSCWML